MLFSKVNLKTSIIILMIFFIGSLFSIKNSFLAINREIDNLALSQITVGQALQSFLKENLGGQDRIISKVTYIINFGEEANLIEEELFFSKDSTVFLLLQDLAQKRNFKIETSYYEGMGILVESIDRIRNGIDDKYWQYWVNNELPMVSADKMELKKDDVVEWKFEPIVF